MGRRPRQLDPTASAAALFGAKIRKYREANGWTQDQLGEKVYCTGDLISKIELAQRAPSRQLAKEADRLFGTGEHFQELWHLVNKETLPAWFRPYSDLESEATSIRTFCLALIHGLLQTEDYAREIFRTGQKPEKLDEFLAARLKRQEILTRSTPPRLWIVLDEKTLRADVGGPEVMKAQLAHLIELAERPNITLQIVRDRMGAYIGLMGSITLLSFDEGPDVAYAEGHLGGQLIEETAKVEDYAVRFDLIRASAMPQRESLAFLKELLEGL